MHTTLDQKTIVSPTLPVIKCDPGGRVQKSIAIDRPVAEVYSFCRNVENLPSFVRHLESVTMIDQRNSYWVVRSSNNHLWAWGVEITWDRLNEIISWRSFEDADIEAAGSVRFSGGPEGRGTVVTLAFRYSTPGKTFLNDTGKTLEKHAQMMIAEDLLQLKILLESDRAPRRLKPPVHEPVGTSFAEAGVV